MPMQVAETTKAKKTPKVLDHVRVKRALDGGHVVEHHYTDYQHEPRAYKFGKDEGGRAAAHIARHAGLPGSGADAVEADGEES
jgi:hypothetical protein